MSNLLNGGNNNFPSASNDNSVFFTSATPNRVAREQATTSFHSSKPTHSAPVKKASNGGAKAPKAKKSPIASKALIIVAALGIVAGIVSCAIFEGQIKKFEGLYNQEVFLEYDSEITIDAFIPEGSTSEISFVSDVSVIDTSHLGVYELTLKVDGKNTKSTLHIVDTTPPVGEAVSQTTFLGRLPDPAECVTNVWDFSEVTVSYEEGYELTTGGDIVVPVVLTDAFGNATTIEVPFMVVDDHNAPNIFGAEDITYLIGTTISYREGIDIVDDYDHDPQLIIDNSQVDLTTVGEYPLTYTAKDACGNERSVTVTIFVVDDADLAAEAAEASGRHNNAAVTTGKETPEDAYRMARPIYNSICNGSMSQAQKAMKIFYWVNHNITFASGTADRRSWASAAVKAFTVRYSSCYGQWAACKALLDLAGIPNRCVWRTGSAKVHVWCLCYINGAWYHCDATQWNGSHNFVFMMTDSEVRRAPGNHVFNGSIYPARATVSVQKYVNVYSGTVSGSMPTPSATPSPTPTPVVDTPESSETTPSDATPTPTVPSTPVETTATPTPVPAETTPAPVETTPAPTTPPPVEEPVDPVVEEG